MYREKGRVWDQVGEYLLASPPVPKDKSGFLNPNEQRSSDQKFVHTILPTREEYENWPRHRQQALEEQEWHRRDHGVWFYNCGAATWLPGQYYYYLNYHRYGDQKPEYREAHRRLYWVWALKVLPDPSCTGLFLHTRRRWGKCLAPGTSIRMFDGSLRNVEDVRIGDQVMGTDSTPRNVVNTYSGMDEMYEIVQNKGMNYTVNSEHIVSLRRNKSTTCSEIVGGVRKYYQSYPQYGDVANIPTKELLAKSAKFFQQFSGYKVAVDYPTRPVRLDPYFLGAWIGDGSTTKPAITTIDPEIHDMVCHVAKSYGLMVRKYDSSGTRCPTYYITGGTLGGVSTNLAKDFNHYELFGNKHIPKDYLINDRETRLQVLAGILDTDAHYSGGVFNLFQKRERVVDDTKQLAESLGFRCTKRKVIKRIASIGFEGEYFKLSVFGHVDTIPTRLPRKKAVCAKIKDPLLTKINEVRPVGFGQYFGFTIDGDNLFLLEDGTVAHNTSVAASIALEAASGIRNFRVGIQSKTEDDAEALFLNEIQAPFLALQECPWFLPQTAGTNKPKRELLFDTPANRKKGAANTPDRLRGLRSKIDWRESTNTAYDSQGLRLFINDEVGKEQRGDPWARHSIVSKQFYPNGYVIGKEFAMTTSDENDDDSVVTCQQFWNQSDPERLTERKGLARYFVPDYEGYMVDAYGRDSAEGLADLDKERRAAEAAGPVDWLRRRRAYPRTIEEAHLPSARSDCFFNAAHIGDALTCIAEHDALHRQPLVRRYRIFGEPGKLALTEDPNGPIYCAWLPPAGWLNQIKQVGTVTTALGEKPRYEPTGTRFSAGADPFDNVTTLREGSKGAFHLAYDWDSKMEDQRGQPGYWPSHGFFVELAERPDDPDTYYKFCLDLCLWAGCKLFCETNKVNLEKYFRLHGCAAFLARAPVATMSEAAKQVSRDPRNARTGAAASPRMIEEYTKAKATFYQKYVGGPASQDSADNPHGPGCNNDGLPYDYRRMPFVRTLTQDLNFNPAEAAIRKKSDLSVSHGYALVSMTGFTLRPDLTKGGGLNLTRLRGLTGGMYR